MMKNKKTWKLLKDKKGSMFPFTVAVVICLMFILLGVCEYMKLMITVSGIKDAYEEAIISVVNDNYNEVYHCVREGYAGGYEPNGGSGFHASLDQGNVQGRLTSLLGLTEEGGVCKKLSPSGTLQYQIYGISVTVHNTPMARSGDKFYADGVLRLEVPVNFAGQTLGYMPVNIKVQAALKEKF